MKIAIAQIRPKKGDIKSNSAIHTKWIEKAYKNGAECLFFPELSLTGYEPELAEQLALDKNASILAYFADLSVKMEIIIAIGAPLRVADGVSISMIFFFPNRTKKIYSKQILHQDEMPFFVSGNEPALIQTGTLKIAPAICYESLQPKHIKTACSMGAQLYLASVAKPQKSIKKAYAHFRYSAQLYNIPILMVNSVGYCDNFVSAGLSAVWNRKGDKLAGLNGTEEGLILFDTDRDEAKVRG